MGNVMRYPPVRVRLDSFARRMVSSKPRYPGSGQSTLHEVRRTRKGYRVEMMLFTSVKWRSDTGNTKLYVLALSSLKNPKNNILEVFHG